MSKRLNLLFGSFVCGVIITFLLYGMIGLAIVFDFHCITITKIANPLLALIQLPIMFVIQWRLCSSRNLSKLHLLLYIINPILSWSVFYFYWHKATKSTMIIEPRNNSRSKAPVFVANIIVLIVILFLIFLLTYTYMSSEMANFRSLVVCILIAVVCLSNFLGGLAIKQIDYSPWLGLTGFVMVFLPLIIYLALPEKLHDIPRTTAHLK